MNAIDLFCGAGGTTLGLIRAGFKVLLGVDLDSCAARNYYENLKIKVLIGDIREIDAELLLKEAKSTHGNIDLISGCPPCQGFTRLHFKEDDPRNFLVLDFLRIVLDIRPKAVLFENVPGITRHYVFEELVNGLQRYGYSLAYDVLDAVNFGVPQHRRRLILIAVRNGRASLPEPTHTRPDLAKRSNLLPWRTVRDAISDLPHVPPGYEHPNIPNHVSMKHGSIVLARIKSIPKNGGSRRHIPPELRLRCHMNCKGFNDVYGRLRWDKPARTLTTGCANPSKGRFIHPEQDRGLTLRECARLQTFPDWYVFSGTFQAIMKMIGEALPPLMAEVLGRHIKKLLEDAL